MRPPTHRTPPGARASSRRALKSSCCPPDADGHADLPALLQELGSRDIVSLLVEGGGVIIGSFFDQRLVDKVTLVIAPKIVGAALLRPRSPAKAPPTCATPSPCAR